jgi:hypothetical protein
VSCPTLSSSNARVPAASALSSTINTRAQTPSSSSPFQS